MSAAAEPLASVAAPQPLLRVSGLRVEDDRGVALVEDISFDVSPAQAVAIVGESGSGKSLTCRSIIGLLAPGTRRAAGSIVLGETDLTACSPAQLRAIRGPRIAMVSQDPMTSLNPVLSIGKQLVQPLRRHLGLGRAEALARAQELLERVEIPSAKRRLAAYPHELSGGMRQRVMIAIGISCHPELLLADEPTTALDVTIQAQILRLLDELRREEQMATLLITHDLGVVSEQASFVYVMYTGSVLEAAETGTLLGRPRHPYTRALLRALPDVLEGDEPQRLHPIPGQPPSPYERPSGCPFRNRCELAVSACATAPMTLAEAVPGHRSACIRHEELA